MLMLISIPYFGMSTIMLYTTSHLNKICSQQACSKLVNKQCCYFVKFSCQMVVTLNLLTRCQIV